VLTEYQKIESAEKREWIKANHPILCEQFASLDKFPPVEKPTTLLMAGSPGAGKTEFSRTFNAELLEYMKLPLNAVRIDTDEVRGEIPGYIGSNSELFQSAACLGVDKLYQFRLKNRQNVILDGTFANYDKSCDNITRSLSKGRYVGIFYIYQEPLVAWKFTQERAKKEGRFVPKEIFIDSLFAAKDNVERAKKEFGNKIIVFLIEKNYESKVKKTYFNVDSIDSYIKIGYNRESLLKEIENV
jgi:predicted ABC-type ATPase